MSVESFNNELNKTITEVVDKDHIDVTKLIETKKDYVQKTINDDYDKYVKSIENKSVNSNTFTTGDKDKPIVQVDNKSATIKEELKEEEKPSEDDQEGIEDTCGGYGSDTEIGEIDDDFIYVHNPNTNELELTKNNIVVKPPKDIIKSDLTDESPTAIQDGILKSKEKTLIIDKSGKPDEELSILDKFKKKSKSIKDQLSERISSGKGLTSSDVKNMLTGNTNNSSIPKDAISMEEALRSGVYTSSIAKYTKKIGISEDQVAKAIDRGGYYKDVVEDKLYRINTLKEDIDRIKKTIKDTCNIDSKPSELMDKLFGNPNSSSIDSLNLPSTSNNIIDTLDLFGDRSIKKMLKNFIGVNQFPFNSNDASRLACRFTTGNISMSGLKDHFNKNLNKNTILERVKFIEEMMKETLRRDDETPLMKLIEDDTADSRELKSIIKNMNQTNINKIIGLASEKGSPKVVACFIDIIGKHKIPRYKYYLSQAHIHMKVKDDLLWAEHVTKYDISLLDYIDSPLLPVNREFDSGNMKLSSVKQLASIEFNDEDKLSDEDKLISSIPIG